MHTAGKRGEVHKRNPNEICFARPVAVQSDHLRDPGHLGVAERPSDFPAGHVRLCTESGLLGTGVVPAPAGSTGGDPHSARRHQLFGWSADFWPLAGIPSQLPWDLHWLYDGIPDCPAFRPPRFRLLISAGAIGTVRPVDAVPQTPVPLACHCNLLPGGAG